MIIIKSNIIGGGRTETNVWLKLPGDREGQLDDLVTSRFDPHQDSGPHGEGLEG